jgi:RHS repeat-associated protein
VPNTTPQYPNLTIVSQYGATQTQTGAVYVAASTESFQPDADGNLISDGRWTYTWDGENRLVQMIRDTDSPAGARQKLIFEYDHQGRRIRKQFFTYSGGWQEQTDTVVLYDGWNLVAELNANASNAKVRSYVWGSDLSGSLQGAGGIGGLLKVTYVGASTTNASVSYDGNGNVAALTDASNGNTCARYEYGPFAEPVRSSDTMAKVNPFRFSSKYRDDETDMLYYGYRYYGTSTGRWLSRDPIGETDGPQLHAFLRNDPTDAVDKIGLCPVNRCDKWNIAVESAVGTGVGASFIGVSAVLRADPSCCWSNPLDWVHDYTYIGGGIGAGLKILPFSVSFNGASADFKTPCIGWAAHNGFGRVTAAGVGAIFTYGIMYLTTPQTYVRITSPSWGFDVSDVTTVGYWRVHTTSYQTPLSK